MWDWEWGDQKFMKIKITCEVKRYVQNTEKEFIIFMLDVILLFQWTKYSSVSEILYLQDERVNLSDRSIFVLIHFRSFGGPNLCLSLYIYFTDSRKTLSPVNAIRNDSSSSEAVFAWKHDCFKQQQVPTVIMGPRENRIKCPNSAWEKPKAVQESGRIVHLEWSEGQYTPVTLLPRSHSTKATWSSGCSPLLIASNKKCIGIW